VYEHGRNCSGLQCHPSQHKDNDLCCKKENDGTLKDRKEQKMINLKEKKIRQEFVRRYLNAETTQEEEQLLAEFLSNADIALTCDEEDVLLMLQSSKLIKQRDITTDKADEFDRLMNKGRGKRNGIVAIRWVASAAAAVICLALLIPKLRIDRTKDEHEVAMTVPPVTDVESAEASEAHSISTSELLETVHILSEMNSDDIIITASSCHDGFIVKTANSNGPSSSYMLKRCSDGTSIELTSQSINF
jgi:hypothetical protein